MKKLLPFLLFALILAFVPSMSSAQTDDGLLIGFSQVTLQSPFYVELKEGAEAAAEANGHELIFLDANGDVNKQNNDIQDLITRGVDVLILNPVNPEAVIPSIEAASEAGIPVITVDRPVTEGAVTHIGRDNVEMGRLVGAAVLEHLGDDVGDATVIEIQGAAGGIVMMNRRDGFHEVVEEAGVEIVEGPYAEYIRANAVTAMQDLLEANSEVDVVYAHNDDMALGALQVLREAGRDDVVVAGVDGLTEALEVMAEGGNYIATSMNDPRYLGDVTIQTAEAVVAGVEVPEFIDAGTTLVTPDNVQGFLSDTLFATYRPEIDFETGVPMSPETEATVEPLLIGFSQVTLQSPFYVELKEGAEAAAEANGHELIFLDANGDVNKQNNDIQDLITRGVDVLILNPVNPEAVIPSIEAASEAGIPVITVDRPVTEGAVTHIGRDNVEMGRLVGAAVLEYLGDGAADATIIEIQGAAGGIVMMNRRDGFHEVVEEAGVEIVEGPYAEYIRANAVVAMQDLLEANSEVDVVYAHNDDMALGALQVLREAGRDDVVVAGVDGLTEALEVMAEGGNYIATSMNDPRYLGDVTIQTAEVVAAGGEVPSFVDAGTTLVTQDNVEGFLSDTLFATYRPEIFE